MRYTVGMITSNIIYKKCPAACDGCGATDWTSLRGFNNHRITTECETWLCKPCIRKRGLKTVAQELQELNDERAPKLS